MIYWNWSYTLISIQFYNDLFDWHSRAAQRKTCMFKDSVLLRKTSCASGERLASLVFRLRRTLAPSALNTRAPRSWLISHGPRLTESLTKTTVHAEIIQRYTITHPPCKTVKIVAASTEIHSGQKETRFPPLNFLGLNTHTHTNQAKDMNCGKT